MFWAARHGQKVQSKCGSSLNEKSYQVLDGLLETLTHVYSGDLRGFLRSQKISTFIVVMGARRF